MPIARAPVIIILYAIKYKRIRIKISFELPLTTCVRRINTYFSLYSCVAFPHRYTCCKRIIMRNEDKNTLTRNLNKLGVAHI